jgi:hypothetical protein
MGITTIVCRRGQQLRLGPCQECYLQQATKLCDGPRPAGKPWRKEIPGSDKTCSKPLCANCAVHVAPDKDFCREHKDPSSRRLAL